MGVKTNIEWTHSTWNCLRGCSVVSSGCKNCYAQSVAYRFSGKGQFYEGFAVLKNGHASWTGKVEFIEEHLLDPIRWKTPRMIFVNSMSDLFHENVTDEMRDQIFAVMALSPQHKFQCLTKRPERMRAYLSEPRILPGLEATPSNSRQAIGLTMIGMITGDQKVARLVANMQGDCTVNGEPGCEGELSEWPLPNVWMGVSCEDQKTADERIPILLQTPAAIRFISAEPLLGPINLDSILGGTQWIGGQRGCGETHRGNGTPECPKTPHHHHDERCNRGLDWVIVGGESGPGARPCRLWWCHDLIIDCRDAGVAVFLKQMGGNITDEDQKVIQKATGKSVHDRKGGDIEEFPPYMRVREFPA